MAVCPGALLACLVVPWVPEGQVSGSAEVAGWGQDTSAMWGVLHLGRSQPGCGRDPHSTGEDVHLWKELAWEAVGSSLRPRVDPPC